METHLTTTERHMPYGITCLPTLVNTYAFNPSQTGRYSIYLPRRDGRLSTVDLDSWLYTGMIYLSAESYLFFLCVFVFCVTACSLPRVAK